MNNSKEKNGKFILTGNNIAFDFHNPTIDMINFDDICMGLFNTCRYNGQIKRGNDILFYSVFDHILDGYEIFGKFMTKKERISWLFHDTAEAYIGDMCAPIKVNFPEFIKMEDNILNIIYQKYNVHDEIVDIKKYDIMMWELEEYYLRNNYVFNLFDKDHPPFHINLLQFYFHNRKCFDKTKKLFQKYLNDNGVTIDE